MPHSTSTNPLPEDYLERVYAGVLGKLIGVYLGRPIEQRKHQDIIKEHGHVQYYLPSAYNLVDADDDVSGTFTFIRALEEHGSSPNISAREIGKTWLNLAIEHKCPFWFGGKGYSTEHTALLNLLHGIEAPRSGSIETNGKTIAEQIGGQIFIDGWALVAPGNPDLAAKIADAAASVSHDGEARYAARLWAAMESEAFISSDVNHLLEVGLSYVPSNSLLAKVISDVRHWSKTESDWLVVRQKIEDNYGYHKFPGSCHVMPNHAIMILSILYGGHSFHEALRIVNTCGWDTDCNSGNVGCLLGVMHGLQGLDQGGPDWRGPLADRAIISSADGGYSINNGARIAYDIANLGRRMVGLKDLPKPKNGAQFHFSLPGSVQGFQGRSYHFKEMHVKLQQIGAGESGSGLQVEFGQLEPGETAIEIMTSTFTPVESRIGVTTYKFVGCPLISPGQKVSARFSAPKLNTSKVEVTLQLEHYGPNDKPKEMRLYDANPDLDRAFLVRGPSLVLAPGEDSVLEWDIRDEYNHQPILSIGYSLSAPETSVTGTVVLDYLRWDGTPHMVLKRPPNSIINPAEAWREAWIDNTSTFNWYMPSTFGISKDKGEGSIMYGTREWKDYQVTAVGFQVPLAAAGGLMVRNQGVNRYYALHFTSNQQVEFVRAYDEGRKRLASKPFCWEVDRTYTMSIKASGNHLRGYVDEELVLEVLDDTFGEGGIGLVVLDGAASVEEFHVAPVYD